MSKVFTLTLLLCVYIYIHTYIVAMCVYIYTHLHCCYVCIYIYTLTQGNIHKYTAPCKCFGACKCKCIYYILLMTIPSCKSILISCECIPKPNYYYFVMGQFDWPFTKNQDTLMLPKH